MRWLATLVLAALWAAYPLVLDERVATWTGYVPKRGVEAEATRRLRRAPWAVDLSPESNWRGSVDEGVLTVTFRHPVRIAGITVDAGNEKSHVARRIEFTFFDSDPDAGGRRPRVDHVRKTFHMWSEYALPKPAPASRLELRARGTTFSERWRVADLAFRLEDPLPVDMGAYREALLGGLPSLLLLLALPWTVLGRRRRSEVT